MPNFETVLRNALKAHPRGKIIKICVLLHVNNHETPHVHIQVHTRAPDDDEAESRPWETVGVAQSPSSNRRVTDDSVLAWLRAKAQEVNGGTVVPFHIHQDDKKPKGTAAEFVELLWSTCHVLTAYEAAAIRVECPVCLLEMQAGDELVCLPCDGAHVGHWTCMQPWLKQAASCPCCRFEMPTSSEEQERFDPLIQQTLKGVKQVISSTAPLAKTAASGRRPVVRAREVGGTSLPSIAAKAHARIVAPGQQLATPPLARQRSSGETPSRMPPTAVPRPPPPPPTELPTPPTAPTSHGLLPSIRQRLGGYARRIGRYDKYSYV